MPERDEQGVVDADGQPDHRGKKGTVEVTSVNRVAAKIAATEAATPPSR